MSDKKRTVGFVGVGNIGTPMVLSLLRAGIDVLVRDLRKDQAAECLAAGARFAESNEALVAECDVIGIAVVNDKQLTGLFRAEGGLLDLARPGDDSHRAFDRSAGDDQGPRQGCRCQGPEDDRRTGQRG